MPTCPGNLLSKFDTFLPQGIETFIHINSEGRGKIFGTVFEKSDLFAEYALYGQTLSKRKVEEGSGATFLFRCQWTV